MVMSAPKVSKQTKGPGARLPLVSHTPMSSRHYDSPQGGLHRTLTNAGGGTYTIRRVIAFAADGWIQPVKKWQTGLSLRL
jgi:hypothetical protein